MFLSVLAISANPYKKDINYDCSLYGGYNFISNGLIFRANIGFEFMFFRADIDIGKNSIYTKKYNDFFNTIGISGGFFYGKRHKEYLLIGVQTYAYVNTAINPNHFRSDHLYGTLKLGYQYSFKERLFLGLEFMHLFYNQKQDAIHFPNTNFCIGIGLRF